MTADNSDQFGEVTNLLATPGLSDALESDRFKQFLDHVPIAIAVSELHPSEKITYCNLEFQRLIGGAAAVIEGRGWTALPGVALVRDDQTMLADAVVDDDEYLGKFTIERDGARSAVRAWSNTFESDDGVPMFRLVALAACDDPDAARIGEITQASLDIDKRLRELQHRHGPRGPDQAVGHAQCPQRRRCADAYPGEYARWELLGQIRFPQ